MIMAECGQIISDCEDEEDDENQDLNLDDETG